VGLVNAASEASLGNVCRAVGFCKCSERSVPKAENLFVWLSVVFPLQTIASEASLRSMLVVSLAW
jgi:hypothetical protein